MKKLAGLVVIIAVLVLGSYFGMGLVTERTLKRSIEIANHSTGLTMSVDKYQRHWFSSSAILDIKLHVPEREVINADGKHELVAAQDYMFNVPVVIQHGPIIYSDNGVLFGLGYAQSNIHLPQQMMDSLASNFAPESTQPKFKLNMFVNYLNQSRFEIQVPTFKLVFKEGAGEADWQGLKGEMHVSSNLKNFNGNFTLSGIKVTKDKMSAVLSSVTSDYIVHKTNEGLYLGQAGFSVPSLVVTEDGKTLFDLSLFKARTESSITKGLFESNFKTSFEKIISNDKQYGPGLLEVSIKNLDAKVLAHLNDQANKLKASSATERQQIMFSMLPELPKLFSQGAGFEVSTLKLTVPEGDIDGHFALSLPKSENVNPFQIMQKVEGDGKIQLPSAVVKKLLVQSLLQKASAMTSPQSKVMPQLEQKDSQNASTPVEKRGEVAQGSPVNQENAVPGNDTADKTQQAMVEADKKLAALVEAKVLVEQGQNYVVEFHLSGGKLNINGQPFDPNAFKI